MRGQRPPVLLLHGFPQTHVCWRGVVAALVRAHTVVAPDLPGYGASSAPAGGPSGEGFTKREWAAGLIELMATLGHERFAVVGHDRGGRAAYRMALDHPERVERVAVLNVLPTLVQFERMGAGPSLGYWPWFLLAQPAPFPERLIAAEPEHFLRFIFDSWTHEPGAIGPEAFGEYLRAARDTGPLTVITFRSSGAELVALSSLGRPFFKPLWPENAVGMVLEAEVDWDEVAALLTESSSLSRRSARSMRTTPSAET